MPKPINGKVSSMWRGTPRSRKSKPPPSKIYFTPSEQEYLAFNRQFPTIASREAEEKRLPIELILADGTTYEHEGRVEFANRQVDQNTGTIRIAALFPNPGNILRPGGYGQVRAITRIQSGALLLPQRAVSEVQGSYQVAVLDSENKVSVRNVKVGDRVGNMWIITDGLKPGERVIAEGVQKVGPGVRVNPKPFAAQSTAENGR